MEWQTISTANWRNLRRNKFLLFGLFIFCVSCAAQHPEIIKVPSSSVPGKSSWNAFLEGLKYVREHPASSEEEQIQRFLWLDRWVQLLQENVVLYEIYHDYLRDQWIEEGLKALEEIQEDGISDLYQRAHELLKLKEDGGDIAVQRIGVLLPLSGELKAFGEDALHSIQTVSDLQYSSGIEFVIEDTGPSGNRLVDAWQNLAIRENVSAIIGPLTTEETKWAFERGELLSIPVISLAPKEDLEMLGPYSFRSNLLLQDQIETLSEFLKKDLKAQRVAVMVPDSVYGWDVLKVVIPELNKQGLGLVETKIYPSGTTDFEEPLRQMTRLDFPRLRKDELCPKEEGPKTQAAIPPEGPEAKPVEELLPRKCVKKINDLEPVVQFEVLLVADFANTAGFSSHLF